MCVCVYVRALKDPLLTAGDGIMRAKEGGGRMHAGDARMGRLNPSARPSATRISHPYLSVCPSLRPPDRPLSLGASVRPPDRPLSLGVSLLASPNRHPSFGVSLLVHPIVPYLSAPSSPMSRSVPPCVHPIVPYLSGCPSLRPPSRPLSLGVSLRASQQFPHPSMRLPCCPHWRVGDDREDDLWDRGRGRGHPEGRCGGRLG